jgi:PAS domain S-box-containing protein
VHSIDEVVRRRAEAVAAGDMAVIATDVTGRILYWNHAAEELYGWTSEEALGLNVVDVTPAITSQPEAAQVMKVLRSAESWSGTFKVRDKAGRTFVVQVTDSPVLDEYGKLIGIIGVSTRA